MHSTVRERAGIGFTGDSYEQSFVLADVRMSWPLRADEVMLFVSPEGLVVIAPLPGGRHRIVATVDEAPEQPGIADVQRLLDTRGPGGARVDEIVWELPVPRPPPACRPLPRRPRAARRRRRPRPQSSRWPGDEHRNPGRGRARSRAGRGARRTCRRERARSVRANAPAHRPPRGLVHRPDDAGSHAAHAPKPGDAQRHDSGDRPDSGGPPLARDRAVRVAQPLRPETSRRLVTLRA